MNIPNYFEDPKILHLGCEENRAYFIPYDPEDLGPSAYREDSSRFLPLNGEWGFRYFESVLDLPDDFWNEYIANDTIPVPSVWQNFGYDRHQYTNVRYPFPYDPPYVPKENPVGVYQRSFEMDALGTYRYYLNFEGVDSCFYLWINGSFAGYSQVSHSTSEFDITELLSEGDNDITVAVLKWCDGSYLEDQDKLRMSGIFRDVYILKRPKVHIRDFFLHTDLNRTFTKADLRVEIEFGGKQDLHLALISPSGELVAEKVWKGAGSGEFSLKVENPVLWNAEDPRQYTLILGMEDEVIFQKVGFRKIEVKKGVVLLNGQPIRFKGVNRHDSDPYTGAAIDEEQALVDLTLMKEHNINAIRTSHYPNAPWFPQLCSEMGFYVVAEADLETHGTTSVIGWSKYGDGSYIDNYAILAEDERFREANLDRQMRNVHRDKNNASVLIWSLGNEAGYGKNFEYSARWVKAFDPDRLLHYERCHDNASFQQNDTSMLDLFSRMYTPVSYIDAYFDEKKDPRPFMLCEFIHAMGNGPGGTEEYYQCMLRHPGFVGGFVWEWCDHAVYQGTTPEGRVKFGYGGDFGEFPHDGNFCMDGLVYPDRRVSESLLEYKQMIRPVRAEVVDAKKGLIRLTNQLDFTDLQEVLAGYGEVSVDGEIVESFLLPELACAPRQSVVAKLPYTLPAKGNVYLNLYYIQRSDALLTQCGHEMGFDQLKLRSDKIKLPAQESEGGFTVTESSREIVIEAASLRYTFDKVRGEFTHLVYKNQDRLAGPMSFSIWRAPTDNDRHIRQEWERCGFDRVIPRVYSAKVKEQKGLLQLKVQMCLAPVYLQPVLQLDVTYLIGTDGSIDVKVRAEKEKDMAALPRFGLKLLMPKEMQEAYYLGYGPVESYCDKHQASLMGLFDTSASENYVDYIKPQEHGSHFGTLHASVVNARGEGLKAASPESFSFQISEYTPEELSAKMHNYELEKAPYTVVHFDYKQHGIGSNSCGPVPFEPYRFEETDFEFHLRLSMIS